MSVKLSEGRARGDRVVTFNTLNKPKTPGNPDDSHERGNRYCLASANRSLSVTSGFPPARERRVWAGKTGMERRERRVNELPGFMTRLPWKGAARCPDFCGKGGLVLEGGKFLSAGTFWDFLGHGVGCLVRSTLWVGFLGLCGRRVFATYL